MTNRPQVPKFGEWTEDAPFTVVFEKASKSKKNSSSPNEYPDMNPSSRNSRHDPPSQNVRPRHKRFSSREETEFRPFTPSPAHNNRNNIVRAPPAPETYNHQSSGGGVGRSVGNPSEINRRQTQDHASVQPRPIRNLRGRSSERVATIPPFPVSSSNAESYTLIFDKVNTDRNHSVRSYNGTAHSTPSRPTNDQRQEPLPTSPKSCCFPPWNRRGNY